MNVVALLLPGIWSAQTVKKAFSVNGRQRNNYGECCEPMETSN